MKHIKKYNESKSEDLEDYLQEFFDKHSIIKTEQRADYEDGNYYFIQHEKQIPVRAGRPFTQQFAIVIDVKRDDAFMKEVIDTNVLGNGWQHKGMDNIIRNSKLLENINEGIYHDLLTIRPYLESRIGCDIKLSLVGQLGILTSQYLLMVDNPRNFDRNNLYCIYISI